MIKNFYIKIFIVGFAAFAITACGAKGIDRKLDYSSTEEKLGESFGKAMEGATPDQQNVLRERQMILMGVVNLAAHSNPATMEANQAKKNADEFERLSKMTVRELFVDTLEKRQNILNSLIKFKSGNGLKVESVEIKDVDPKDISQFKEISRFHATTATINGVISIRNDSEDFIYDLRGCQLALILDGKQIEELHDQECGGFTTIQSKGGKVALTFSHRIPGEENIKIFYDLFNSGQVQKIAWNFKPSNSSYIKSNSNDIVVGEDQNLNGELQKITADLAVLKK